MRSVGIRGRIIPIAGITYEDLQQPTMFVTRSEIGDEVEVLFECQDRSASRSSQSARPGRYLRVVAHLVFMAVNWTFVGKEVSFSSPQWGQVIWSLILAAIWF